MAHRPGFLHFEVVLRLKIKICFHCTWTAWIYASQFGKWWSHPMLENERALLMLAWRTKYWATLRLMIDTEKQKGSAPFAKKAIEMVQSEFQTYRCWGPLLGLITLDSSSNSEGGMFRFIDSPQRETFLLIVYSKLEIFKGDSAAFAVQMIVTLRICSIIDIMFNLTQMKMRLWGIEVQVCCTDAYIGMDCFILLHKRYIEECFSSFCPSHDYK